MNHDLPKPIIGKHFVLNEPSLKRDPSCFINSAGDSVFISLGSIGASFAVWLTRDSALELAASIIAAASELEVGDGPV